MKREVIRIDEGKCNGCGLCIPNCPEGALQVTDGKARLISDLFCDGLGACIGHCPQGAITVEKREAEPYDEKKVMKNIVKAGPETIKAHLKHLADHGQDEFLMIAEKYLKDNKIKVQPDDAKEKDMKHQHSACGCPGSAMQDFTGESAAKQEPSNVKLSSELRQWPIELHLLNPAAPYLKGAELLVAADCVPFAYADFHRRFLKGKILTIFCPKLDDSAEAYIDKLSEIFKNSGLKSVTIVHMEVPCWFGVESIVQEAIAKSGKNIPIKEYTISIKGDII